MRRSACRHRRVPTPSDEEHPLVRHLRGLGQLHADGVLTDEEFALAKARLLAGDQG